MEMEGKLAEAAVTQESDDTSETRQDFSAADVDIIVKKDCNETDLLQIDAKSAKSRKRIEAQVRPQSDKRMALSDLNPHLLKRLHREGHISTDECVEAIESNLRGFFDEPYAKKIRRSDRVATETAVFLLDPATKDIVGVAGAFPVKVQRYIKVGDPVTNDIAVLGLKVVSSSRNGSVPSREGVLVKPNDSNQKHFPNLPDVAWKSEGGDIVEDMFVYYNSEKDEYELFVSA